MIGIYLATHRASGRAFVGHSKRSMEVWWAGQYTHPPRTVTDPAKMTLSDTLKAYGRESFDLRILGVAEHLASARLMVWDLIARLQTGAPKGFNRYRIRKTT